MITNTQYPPCICGTGEKAVERVPKAATHTHYHKHKVGDNHAYPHDGQEAGTYDIHQYPVHQHEHSHVNHDTPDVPEYDHHSVTKAKEGKDVR